MFEKQAKDYANKWLQFVKDLEVEHKTDPKSEYTRIEQTFKEAAEFGYNKGYHKAEEELKIAQDYNEALGKDYKKLEIENGSLSKRILELEADKGWLIDKIPKWFYVKEKLPPEPEIKYGLSYPLTYICAYRIRDNENEIGDFMYMGNGEFLGENKEYPIYAWLSPSVTIPEFKE